MAYGINYITPSEYAKIAHRDERPLDELQDLANAPERMCEACEAEPVWRLGDCGLCFTCCTGESDASNDYELISELSE